MHGGIELLDESLAARLAPNFLVELLHRAKMDHEHFAVQLCIEAGIEISIFGCRALQKVIEAFAPVGKDVYEQLFVAPPLQRFGSGNPAAISKFPVVEFT